MASSWSSDCNGAFFSSVCSQSSRSLKGGKLLTLFSSFLARRNTKYFLKVEIGLKDVVFAWLIATASSMLNKEARKASRMTAQWINNSLVSCEGVLFDAFR